MGASTTERVTSWERPGWYPPPVREPAYDPPPLPGDPRAYDRPTAYLPAVVERPEGHLPHAVPYAGTHTVPACAPPVPGIAVTSMVLGVVAASVTFVSGVFVPLVLLALPLAVIAFVLGLAARRRIRAEGLGGRRHALAGILTGAIAGGIDLLVIVAIVVVVGYLALSLSSG